jgi:hypothetical protein
MVNHCFATFLNAIADFLLTFSAVAGLLGAALLARKGSLTCSFPSWALLDSNQ